MNIRIVPIAESHIPGFRACLDAVAREKRYLAQFEAPPLERMETFVRENIAADQSQFVALDGETVVGWADIILARAHAMTHCGYLGMGVAAGYRGKGIGRRLLEAAIAKARANGATRIVLEVRIDNTNAIRLYEKLGFITEARKRNALRFDDGYYDALQMVLLAEE